MNRFFVFLVLLFTIAAGAHALKFVPPSDEFFSPFVNGSMTMSPRLTGYGVTAWDPIRVACVTWRANYTGKALVMDTPTHGKSPETMLRNTLREGTQKGYGRPAMIMFPSLAVVAGQVDVSRDFSDMTDINLPTVEVSLYFWALVRTVEDANGTVIVIVRDDDPTPTRLLWPYSTVVCTAILMTTFGLACVIVNVYKFTWHIILTNGITTAKIFFIIDLVANFMRLFYSCINPFFVNHLNYTFTTICTTTHMALTLICTLLIALKWRELLLKTKLKVTVFLDYFKWPFIIAAVIIFLVEFVSSALRGHWYSISQLAQISWSFLIIVGFIIVVLLFVSGIQILRQISRAVGSKRRVWQLNRTTILLLASGIFILAWCLNQTALMIRSFVYKNITLQYVNITTIFQFLFLYTASFLQNWAMPIPWNGSNSTGGTSNSNKGSGSNRSNSTADSKDSAVEMEPKPKRGKKEASNSDDSDSESDSSESDDASSGSSSTMESHLIHHKKSAHPEHESSEDASDSV